MKNDSVAEAVHSRTPLQPGRRGRLEIPWREILTSLEAIEGEGTPEGFFRRTLERLETLVSYDQGIAVVSRANLQGPPSFVVRRIVSTETTDRVRHSIGINNAKVSGPYGFAISLHRHSDRGFSAREQEVLDVLCPHLRNLFRALMEPVGQRELHLLDAASRAGLSVREREIYLLLCDRLTIAEIAQRLYISSHTVAKHIEHIYDKLLVSGRRGACSPGELGDP